ncbi:MAG: hypothetical protein ACK4L7_05040 [Flavobacteriales bacterium]
MGEGGAGEPELKGLDDILHVPGAYLHLYGKHETRTGRKMGHVTIVAEDDPALEQGIAVAKVHARVVPRSLARSH